MDLLPGHAPEATDSGNAELPLAEAARHVVLDELAVLVADGEGGLHGGFRHSVPVH